MKIIPGSRIRLKSHEELVASGRQHHGNYYSYHPLLPIVRVMLPLLGQTVTVDSIHSDREDYFLLKEDDSACYWHIEMVAEVEIARRFKRNLPSWF